MNSRNNTDNERQNKMADRAGADLEEIFLKLTRQDESVDHIVTNLRQLTLNSNKE
jgi:hypothetical protein